MQQLYSIRHTFFAKKKKKNKKEKKQEKIVKALPTDTLVCGHLNCTNDNLHKTLFELSCDYYIYSFP